MPRKKSDKEHKPDANGYYTVWLDAGKKPDGSRKRKPFRSKASYEDAVAKREAYKEDRMLGAPIGSENITVAQWCDKWMSIYRKSVQGTNRQSYDAQIAKIKEKIGLMKMRDVYEHNIQSVINDEADTSKSNIAKMNMVLQQMFRRARANKIIRDNPAIDIQIPQGTEGHHRSLLRWEVDFILANWNQHRFGLLVMILLLAGVRRGEVVALEWEKDVDMEARHIKIQRSVEFKINQAVVKDGAKTEAGVRNIPICQLLYDALNAVPVEKRKGLVCLSAHGDLISKSAFDRGLEGFLVTMERLLNNEDIDQRGRRPKDKAKVNSKAAKKKQTESAKAKAMKKAESTPAVQPEQEARKEFSFRGHDLRYTFATALYDAGVDEKSAQYYLGHRDIKMTRGLYTRLSVEREEHARQKAIDFLDAWIDKKPPVMPDNASESARFEGANTQENVPMATKWQQPVEDKGINIQDNVVFVDFKRVMQ